MFNSVCVIIGTVIGAGFASGKEIFSFFNVYGVYGLIGLFLSEFVLFFIIYKSLKIIIANNISTYSDFINAIFSKSDFLNNVMCNIINIFLVISFIVMVAGFGSFFAQNFKIPVAFGSILIATLSYIIFSGSIDNISKINAFIIPCLIFLIVLLGFKNLKCFVFCAFNTGTHRFNWFISSLLYASYNLVVLLPILITLKKYIFSLRKARLISLISVLFLSFMATILFFLLNFYFPEIMNLDLPTVYIASLSGSIIQYSCGLALLSAIFTTAISNGYGFLNNMNIKNSKSFKLIALTICFSSIIFSNIGFSKLLNLLYPILGLIRFY